MKNNLITGLGCAFALGLMATAAHAQQTADPSMPPPPPGADGGPHGDHPRGGRGFDMMDTNHDGFVSLDEWKAAGRREDRFAMIDIDHNGRITRASRYRPRWRVCFSGASRRCVGRQSCRCAAGRNCLNSAQFKTVTGS